MAKSYGIEGCEIHIRENTDEIKGINDIIEEAKADILLMKTYEKSQLMSLLAGSVAEKAIRETRIPVLVERIEKKSK